MELAVVVGRGCLDAGVCFEFLQFIFVDYAIRLKFEF